MKVRYSGNYGFAGTGFEDEEEVEDNTPDDEIEDYLREIIMQQVEWEWEKIE